MIDKKSFAIQLVRHVRNRMWLADAAVHLNKALWTSATLIAAFGLWHFLYRPVSPMIALGCTVLPFLVNLAILLLRHPSDLTAARVADQQAQADSLLLTAWDLQKRSVKGGTAERMILQQARGHLPEWQAKIATHLSSPRTSFPTFPLILGGIGIALFLLGEKHQVLVHEPVSTIKTSQENAAEANPLAELVQALAKRQDNDATSAPDPNQRGGHIDAQQKTNMGSDRAPDPSPATKTNPRDSETTASPPMNTLFSSARDETTTTQSDEKKSLRESSTSRSKSGGGDLAGNQTLGTPRDTAFSPAAASFLPVKEALMKRTGGEKGQSDIGGQLSPNGPGYTAREIPAQPDRQAAESPDTLQPAGLLSPVQQRLTADYYHQLQQVQ